MDFSSSQKYIQTQTLLDNINGLQNLHVQDREGSKNNLTYAKNAASDVDGSQPLLNTDMIFKANNKNHTRYIDNTGILPDFSAHSSGNLNDLHAELSSPFYNIPTIQNTTDMFDSHSHASKTPLSIHQDVGTPTPTNKNSKVMETYGFVNSFLSPPVWRYIDIQGNTQGPFSSSDMTGWYLQGYFQPTLQLFRDSTSHDNSNSTSQMCNQLITLMDILNHTQNYQDPFNKFDEMLMTKTPVTEMVNPIPNHINNNAVTLAEECSNKDVNIESQIVESSIQKEDVQAIASKHNAIEDTTLEKPKLPSLMESHTNSINNLNNTTKESSTTISIGGSNLNKQKSFTSSNQSQLRNDEKYNGENTTRNSSNKWSEIAKKNAPQNNPVAPVQKKTIAVQKTSLTTAKSTEIDEKKTLLSATEPISIVNEDPQLSVDEFFFWCRKQIKLNDGHSLKDVLELILSLPTDSESESIISETIYASSDTMDGRRFTKEFNQKRRECEKNNSGIQLTELVSSYITDEDDWDFQVVNRKGKKN